MLALDFIIFPKVVFDSKIVRNWPKSSIWLLFKCGFYFNFSCKILASARLVLETCQLAKDLISRNKLGERQVCGFWQNFRESDVFTKEKKMLVDLTKFFFLRVNLTFFHTALCSLHLDKAQCASNFYFCDFFEISWNYL